MAEDKFDLILQRIDKLTAEIKQVNDRLDNQDLRIRPFSNLLMEAQKVTELKGFSHSAVTNSPNTDKFVIPTKKKILVSLDSVDVMSKPKRR